MPTTSFASRYQLDLIEDLYQRWQSDPGSVDERWQAFFEGFTLAGDNAIQSESGAQTSVVRLIYAYRDLGHFEAHLNPLGPPPGSYPLLDLSNYGLRDDDLDRTFDCSAFFGLSHATLRDLIAALRQTYCGTIGVEFMHIQDTNIRRWLEERMEPRRMRPELPLRQKIRTLMTLHYAELFERFLHTRYQGQKRFSLEGGETLIPILDAIVEKAPSLGVKELVMGMAHRGRLNVLANILQKPYQEVFAEFEDNFLPDSFEGDGDVKYHMGFSGDYVNTQGEKVHLSLTPNPSHLEAVNPVVEGRTRAKQKLFGDKGRKHGVPLLIHGDAAFIGQGIVAETFNLAHVDGYTTGGTLHIVVNNQIGFTTNPCDARSTNYCTDIAKMVQAPIFHINGEDPEAAVFVAELALEFRQTFHRDVVIDMYCYRKYGHNETDEPTFTQPLMYKAIQSRPSVSAIYTEKLLKEGALKPEAADAIQREFRAKLDEEQKQLRALPQRKRGIKAFTGVWKGLKLPYSHQPVNTTVSHDALGKVTQALSKVPEGFHVHPKIAKILEGRQAAYDQNLPIDWGFAEGLAFGTLIDEGHLVRLTGQDSRRGTFSHRHAVLYDYQTGQSYTLLSALPAGKDLFVIYDSTLSEAAVLGFEFGYSLDAPHALVLWEAQFGDFVNGAQVIIDQFIVCSESKWQRSSGLVLLLPHGYEGQGPEHSSARLERFLQACAEDNIQVCNLTTPAQYFHALRRQVKRDFRKPLIIMTPKSLLRHKDATSSWKDLEQGQFSEILDDSLASPDRTRRVLLCSGKVFYDLAERRQNMGIEDVAIIRVEQFYPFPEAMLRGVLSRYKMAREWVWVQEESQNMGGWFFIEPRLRAMGYALDYVGRDASSSPATGSLSVHKREQAELIEAALGSPVPHLVRAVSNGSTVVGLGDRQPV